MTKNDVINKIAREILHLETLQTRKMDSLDFKEQAVWSIAEALSAAYQAGQADLLAAAETLLNEHDRTSEDVNHYQRLAKSWRQLRRTVKNARKGN